MLLRSMMPTYMPVHRSTLHITLGDLLQNVTNSRGAVATCDQWRVHRALLGSLFPQRSTRKFEQAKIKKIKINDDYIFIAPLDEKICNKRKYKYLLCEIEPSLLYPILPAPGL